MPMQKQRRAGAEGDWPRPRRIRIESVGGATIRETMKLEKEL